jgi:hypothetical protein
MDIQTILEMGINNCLCGWYVCKRGFICYRSRSQKRMAVSVGKEITMSDIQTMSNVELLKLHDGCVLLLAGIKDFNDVPSDKSLMMDAQVGAELISRLERGEREHAELIVINNQINGLQLQLASLQARYDKMVAEAEHNSIILSSKDEMLFSSRYCVALLDNILAAGKAVE